MCPLVHMQVALHACILSSAFNSAHNGGTGDHSPYHFLSRYFAPWIGCGEDAVTGSAHCALGPYWAQRLSMHGKPMQARQCSHRSGDLTVTVSEGSNTVLIAGQTFVHSPESITLPI